VVEVENPTNQRNSTKNSNSKKSSIVLQYENQVAIGLWIQVIGQIIEANGLSGLLEVEIDANSAGERQILSGVWIRLIGQILEAISVSSQINETDKNKLIEEQKIAIAGDFLASLGSAIEVIGGIEILREEAGNISLLVP
jgi:hypothetical protein